MRNEDPHPGGAGGILEPLPTSDGPTPDSVYPSTCSEHHRGDPLTSNEYHRGEEAHVNGRLERDHDTEETRGCGTLKGILNAHKRRCVIKASFQSG